MRLVAKACRVPLSAGIILALCVPLSACTAKPPAPPAEQVNMQVLKEIAPAPQPDAPDLTTPRHAVKSYTDWMSYAYRVMDAQVATMVMGPYEEVHVDSYIQYNAQRDKGIEQSLQQADYKVVSAAATSAVLAGTEHWLYRYFAMDGTRYLTDPTDASYEITYTVGRRSDGRWLVDKVRAKRLDPVLPLGSKPAAGSK